MSSHEWPTTERVMHGNCHGIVHLITAASNGRSQPDVDVAWMGPESRCHGLDDAFCNVTNRAFPSGMCGGHNVSDRIEKQDGNTIGRHDDKCKPWSVRHKRIDLMDRLAGRQSALSGVCLVDNCDTHSVNLLRNDPIRELPSEGGCTDDAVLANLVRVVRDVVTDIQ